MSLQQRQPFAIPEIINHVLDFADFTDTIALVKANLPIVTPAALRRVWSKISFAISPTTPPTDAAHEGRVPSIRNFQVDTRDEAPVPHLIKGERYLDVLTRSVEGTTSLPYHKFVTSLQLFVHAYRPQLDPSDYTTAIPYSQVVSQFIHNRDQVLDLLKRAKEDVKIFLRLSSIDVIFSISAGGGAFTDLDFQPFIQTAPRITSLAFSYDNPPDISFPAVRSFLQAATTLRFHLYGYRFEGGEISVPTLMSTSGVLQTLMYLDCYEPSQSDAPPPCTASTITSLLIDHNSNLTSLKKFPTSYLHQNLKHLALPCYRVGQTFEEPYVPFPKDFMTHCPNLTSLELDAQPLEFLDSLCRTPNVLEHLRIKLSNPPTEESPRSWTDDTTNLLFEGLERLRTVDITLINSAIEITPSWMKDTTLPKTLQVFRITHHQHAPDPPVLAAPLQDLRAFLMRNDKLQVFNIGLNLRRVWDRELGVGTVRDGLLVFTGTHPLEWLGVPDVFTTTNRTIDGWNCVLLRPCFAKFERGRDDGAARGDFMEFMKQKWEEFWERREELYRPSMEGLEPRLK
ncbi:hypothetical protein HDV00_002757, partial [Rhizophlyctis rosea]